MTHHVGGLLKIAPEQTEPNVLSKMMKPGIGTYDAFKKLFDRYSRGAGKEQYLVPYFIAAHPGATDEDMLNLALWLKKNRFRPDQVQTFMPTPMAIASTMYHTGKNPLEPVSRDSERVETAKKGQVRRLHKAFLRYHDPEKPAAFTGMVKTSWPFRSDRKRTRAIGSGMEVRSGSIDGPFCFVSETGAIKACGAGKKQIGGTISPCAAGGWQKRAVCRSKPSPERFFLSVQDVDGHDIPGRD